MNAAMVPQITALADSATDLIATAGELADKVGQIAQTQSRVWQDVEQHIVDAIADIQVDLEATFPEVVQPRWFTSGPS
jgi:hypothetical protein